MSRMITVLIAGGSGTRLWPLSTPDYPKHLLALTGQHSLIQHTYRRAKTISKHVYVLTDASHAHHVKEQLPELKDDKLIIEPARRGTASCIISALQYLAKRESPEEPIAFLHADHYIRDTAGFTHTLEIAGVAAQKDKRIVLIGVEPDHPATGFGYIQKDGLYDETSLVYNVHSFKEKPDFETARGYVQSGNYLWNCGYFVGTIQAFVKAMKTKASGLYAGYETLAAAKSDTDYKAAYLKLENEAIDYALMEKLNDLLVIPASFDWMDLGSFGDVHKAVESDEAGNYVHGKLIETDDVQNTFIHDSENKPIAVIGLDNVVVVNTPDGILVARKDLAQKVGEASKRLHARKAAEK